MTGPGIVTRAVRVPVVPQPQPPEQGQLDLDSLTPARQEARIQEAFLRFHRENPHVYEQLVKLARRWKSAGNTKCGMGMLFEVLRFRRGLATSGDEFKLNNNYRSRYSRLIMEQEPDLEGFFDVRELQTA